jgi:hypothetical protein
MRKGSDYTQLYVPKDVLRHGGRMRRMSHEKEMSWSGQGKAIGNRESRDEVSLSIGARS